MAPGAAELARVLDGLGEAVVTAGPEGLITGWAGAAGRIFGFSEAEVLGRPLTWLLVEGEETELEELSAVGGAERADLLALVRRRHGGPVRSAVSIAALGARDGQPEGTVAVIRPVAGWLEARGPAAGVEWESTLGRLVRELVDLAGTQPAALERTGSLARLILEQGRRMIPDAEVMLSLVPAERQGHFVIAAGAGPWAEGQVGRSWARDGTLAGRAMALHRTIETVRLRAQSSQRASLDEGGIDSGRLVPLWTRRPLPDGRDAIGVLGFYRPGRRYFTPHERRLIEQLARFASLTLQHSELAEGASRAAGRLQVAVDAAYDLSRSLDEREVVERLLVRVQDAVAGDRAAVLAVEGNEAIVLSVRGGVGPDSTGRRFPLAAALDHAGQPFVLRAVETLRPARARGYQVIGMPDAENAFLGSLVRTIAIPLPVSGGAVGVLVFGRLGDPDFSDEEVALLRTVGNLAALAIRNAALYARVEEAARVKSDFLNMAAHELRTPLTVIRGYLSMMRDGSFGELPAQLHRPLEILAGKSDELGRLVDDLLTAARIDTDRLVVNAEPLDLNEAAAAAIDRARVVGRERRADVRLVAARRPVVVSADRGHLDRVLDALVANALAFGGERPWVRVTVEVGRRGAPAAVTVADHGRGVPAAERERIFERFYRFDHRDRPLEAGTGLGLYIARGLASAMGGRLVLAETEPGAGSTFRAEFAELETPRGD